MTRRAYKENPRKIVANFDEISTNLGYAPCNVPVNHNIAIRASNG
jgi:hypothetical protein